MISQKKASVKTISKSSKINDDKVVKIITKFLLTNEINSVLYFQNKQSKNTKIPQIINVYFLSFFSRFLIQKPRVVTPEFPFLK